MRDLDLSHYLRAVIILADPSKNVPCASSIWHMVFSLELIPWNPGCVFVMWEALAGGVMHNPVYPPMFYSNYQIETKPVKIIGKIVELRGNF